MKKYMFFLCAFIAPFMLVSCPKPNNPKPEPVNPVARELVGIEVFQPGPTRFFTTDEEFSYTGLVIELKYDQDPTSEFLFLESIPDLAAAGWSIDYTAFTENLLNVGDARVTAEDSKLAVKITYTLPSGKTFHTQYAVSFGIVIDRKVKNIAIVEEPLKKDYKHKVAEDADLDTKGLLIELTFEGDDTQDPPILEETVPRWAFNSEQWKFIGFSNSADDDDKEQTITVHYVPDPTNTPYDPSDPATFIELLDAFKVNVITQILGFSVDPTSAHKTEYLVGDDLDTTGLKLSFQYSNPTKNDTYTDFTETEDQFFEFTENLPNKASWHYPVKVRRFEKNADGSSTLKNECTFLVDVYAGAEIIIPPELTADGKNVFFDAEPESFFRDEFVKAGNFVEILAKVTDDADVEHTITRPVELIDSRIGVTLSGTCFDDVNKVFVLPEGTLDPTAQAHVSYKEAPEATAMGKDVSLSIVKPYQFHETIEKFTGDLPGGVSVQNDDLYATNTPCNVLDTVLKFVTFGDYPQTLAKIEGSNVGKDLHIYQITERKKQGTGGMDMYLGSDGGYYVKVKAKRHNELGSAGNFPTGMSPGDQYNFVDTKGNTVSHSDWNNQTCWFRVEPLLWRVLDTEYKGAGTETIGALLWSVKAVERMPYFADADSPDDSGQGGKSSRTDKNNDEIKWYSYKYSTLRAFLRGEYEDDDEQADLAYKQVLTGKGENEELVGKFNVAGEKLGFLQRAFTQDARSHLKQVDLGEGMNDYVFVLSKEELTKSEADYYFISVGKGPKQADAQQQRAKNPTQYAMAREAKRWSYKNNGVDFSYPGSSSWTRTFGDYGVSAVTGFGHMLYNAGGTSIGRGAFKDGTVVPAICVDSAEITALWP